MVAIAATIVAAEVETMVAPFLPVPVGGEVVPLPEGGAVVPVGATHTPFTLV